MIHPLVAVSISASRASLDENLEREERSSRIWVTPPNEVRVVLSQSEADNSVRADPVGAVATVVSNHIVIEGGVPLAADSLPSFLTREQHVDALASAVFHKLRSGDEVMTVMHGPSGCGKTVSLFGSELDLTHPTKAPPSACEGLLWHVLTRVFSLSTENSDTIVEVGLSVIEYRSGGVHASSSSDDDDVARGEEAVDLLHDTVDVVTSSGAFANMPHDVPLAQYVLCRDALEFRTALMVALSRSQSWVTDEPLQVGFSDASAVSESRLEHASRASGAAPVRGVGATQPLIPTMGSASHLNVNVIVKVTQPTQPTTQASGAPGPTSVNSSRANRALNVAQGEALPPVVDTKTTCSIWRIYDLLGPQLFDFSSNPVAAMATKAEHCFLKAALTPVQSARISSGPSPSVVAVPPTPPPFNPSSDSLCAHVITSILRQASAYVVWVCALRFDYSFDDMNAEAVRIAAWVRERCGRPLSLLATQKAVKEKHLHVARRLMDSHAVPARAYFAEVMDLRRSTTGSRYATLTYHMVLQPPTQTSQHARRSVSQAAVSPQSISLDGGMSEWAGSDYNGLQAASRMGRSTSSVETITRSMHRFPSGGSASAGGNSGGGSRRAVSTQQREDRNASFTLETAPTTKPLPSHLPGQQTSSKQSAGDDITQAVEALEASLMSRRRLSAAAREARDDDDVEATDERRNAHVAGNSNFTLDESAHVSQAAVYASRAVAASYTTMRHGVRLLHDEGNNDAHVNDVTLPQMGDSFAEGGDSWRSVLQQFRGDYDAPPLPSPQVTHALSHDLMQPSKGGTLPRGAEPQPLQGDTTGRAAVERGGGSRSVSASQHGTRPSVEDLSNERHRQMQDECSALRAEVEALRSSEADAQTTIQSQREELATFEQQLRNASSNMHRPADVLSDGGAAAIAHMVQPVLSRLEEDSAAVLAKLLTTKRQEIDDASLLLHQSSQPLRTGDVHQRQDQRNGPHPLPAASIRDIAELQRRVKGLQRELLHSRDQHELTRVEILDAANKSITSHKEAFTKILNESGAMYAKLNKAYQDTTAAYRETTLRLENTTDACRALRSELATKTASEEQLRRAVKQLQADKERLLRLESMQNAVCAVSTMFANASVASADSAGVPNDSSSSLRGGRGSPSHSTRCVFDASLDQPTLGVNTLKKSMRGDAQRTHAEAIGMLSFQSALNHLYRAATGPMEALQGTIAHSAHALSGTPACTTDVVVAQTLRSLEATVDEVEKRKLQVQLHVDIVREEAAKLDIMYREIQQREQQYLQVLISR